MHDILESVARVTFASLINYLKENKRYKIDTLNSELSRFKYGRIDSENKVPSDLFTDLSTFKISARHMWTLIRIYPLMCSDEIRALPHLRLLHISCTSSSARNIQDYIFYIL